MKNNQGSIMVMSLVITTAVLILLGVFLGSVVAERRNVERSFQRAQVLHIAEAGIEKAIRDLNEEDISSPYPAISGSVADIGTFSVKISGPSFAVTITSTGSLYHSSKNIERKVRIQVISLGGFLFDNAVVATDGLTIGGGGHVLGDVLIGTGTTPPASDDVTGTITEANLDLPPVPPPPPPYDFDYDGDTLKSSTITQGGTYRYEDIKVTSGTLLIAATDSLVTIYSEGIVNILTKLRIVSGASVRLHAGGNVNIAGDGVINESGDPTNFVLFADGKCDIAGSSDFYGIVYAPEIDIKITGGGIVYGCIIGDTVTVGGGGEIRYDPRAGGLEVPGLDCFLPVVGSWKEIRGS